MGFQMTTAEYATLLGAIYLAPLMPRWFLLLFGNLLAMIGGIKAYLEYDSSELLRILQQLM